MLVLLVSRHIGKTHFILAHMHQEPTYVLENGLYVFYLNNQRVFESASVAILFDKENGVLLKHGVPDIVRETIGIYEAKLSQTEDGHVLLDALEVVEGAFNVEELNKVINIMGYILQFYERYTTTKTIRWH